MSQHEKPTHATTGPTASSSKLPATLRLGAVHLTVTDLDRSVAFYEDAIGLRLHRRKDSLAVMGAGEEDLLILYEEPGARRAGRHAGLDHFALLFPSREELARGTAFGGDEDPDPGRLRPRHARGHLPA
jgi:catechol 2,3-dioxygenase